MQHFYSWLIFSRLHTAIHHIGLWLWLSAVTTTAVAQSFGAPVRYATGLQPQGIAVADVNADGRPDLITADYSSNTVSVLLQQAAAATIFSTTPITYSSGGSKPVDVATGDVNGDGHPDIILSNTTSNTVGVLLNSPVSPGTFLPVATYASGGGEPRGIAIGDVNGDGRLDIVVANQAGSSVCVLLNSVTTPGTFLAATRYASGTFSTDVVLGDVNGDGWLDIGVLTVESIAVLLNSATVPGTFLPAVICPAEISSLNYRSLAIGDVNGDGHLDLVFTILSSNTVGVLLNSATTPGAFTVLPKTYSSGTSGPNGIGLGDINGDGRLDIVTANFNNNNGSTISVLLNSATAAGTFPAATVLATGGTGPLNVVVRDLTGDGRPDLAVTNFNSSTVSVFANTGTYLGETPALAVAEMSLYPNPTHNSFTLELPALPQAVRAQATLFNSLGQVVRQQQSMASGNSTRLTFVTAGLAVGVYTLRLWAGDAMLTRRVVVE